ncbi:hypothetical protein CesoFtcFv8_004537 [Champsocephalus esox]|uniref:Uncharacterized protein n=2 Tax=Champsocephalus TaxID=52236 RepID=A0AAN8HVS2_CHAGU|nr:hypothetical protein CesoFtcFv8_004537 [Champsocephalus esox]KAK5930156.1 hypothetical protein CgunFtcFv8_026417 [Champsocephalus gunnari]
MIKQNRVWVQSLTLRHTLAATQRRLHPLHHPAAASPHSPPLCPSMAPVAHTDPNQRFMTGLTSLTTRPLRLGLYLSVMRVPEERVCRRRRPPHRWPLRPRRDNSGCLLRDNGEYLPCSTSRTLMKLHAAL